MNNNNSNYNNIDKNNDNDNNDNPNNNDSNHNNDNDNNDDDNIKQTQLLLRRRQRNNNKIIHRYHDSLPLIELTKGSSSSTTTSIPYLELEDILEELVYDVEHNEEQNEKNNHNNNNKSNHQFILSSQRTPIFYPFTASRNDLNYLHCDNTQDNNNSITGIRESLSSLICSNNDDNVKDNDNSDVNVNIHIYQSHFLDNKSLSKTVIEEEPVISLNPSWNRQDELNYIPPTILSTSLSEQKSSKTIQWIDFRNVTMDTNISNSNSILSLSFLPTNASCAYFLRSILSTYHDRTPWLLLNQKQQDYNNDDYDCVCMLFTAQMEKEENGNHQAVMKENPLIQFRVSDVCPSWYLYSVITLDLNSYYYNNKDNNATTSSSSSFYSIIMKQLFPKIDKSIMSSSLSTHNIVEMFIYHKFPYNRQRLSSIHPISKQIVPIKGCLWETIMIPTTTTTDSNDENENKNDNEHNNNNDTTQPTTDTVPISKIQLSSPPYIDFELEYGNNRILELLKPYNIKIIQDEVFHNIPQWTPWPESQHYSSTTTTTANTNDDVSSNNNTNMSSSAPVPLPPWNVFPLCYCFPSNDITKRQWINTTCHYVPKTIELLNKYINMNLVRTILFSKLNSNCILNEHNGWEDLANYVYRIHIPIYIPHHTLCGVWVDGVTMISTMDHIISFDDSKVHRAFNYACHPNLNHNNNEDDNDHHHGYERIVLIVDMIRPNHMPTGTATGGHSNELDEFIQQYS